MEIEDLGGKWGLVHWTQLINQVQILAIESFSVKNLIVVRQAGSEKVTVGDVVSDNQEVWVKVIAVDVEAQKISLSMKYVDQETGRDLDPFQVPWR